MNKEIILNLNKKLISSVDESFPLGLTHGEMGMSLYFYYLSRIEQNEEYKIIADKLLEDVYNNLSFDYSITVENGMAGIGLGITNLVKNRFIEGDVNELLEDIDNVIFKKLAFPQYSAAYKKDELLHLLYYLSVRLDDQTDEEGWYIFQELIIKVINQFAVGLKGDFFNEYFSFSVYHYHLPVFVYVCSKLLEQNFYNERIHKILEEFEPMILGRFPLLHANRLYLLCGMLPLIPYMQNPQWKNYAGHLQREISVTDIFVKEMKNKHIFVSNGLSLMYLLFFYLENNHPAYRIDYSPDDFYRKITESEVWTSLFKRDYYFNIHRGLLNGFPGVQLALSLIQKQSV